MTFEVTIYDGGSSVSHAIKSRSLAQAWKRAKADLLKWERSRNGSGRTQWKELGEVSGVQRWALSDGDQNPATWVQMSVEPLTVRWGRI